MNTNILINIPEEITNKTFENLGELTPEEYCLKVIKQLNSREISITSKEFFAELKRYFIKNILQEYVLMDIVKYFQNLYE